MNFNAGISGSSFGANSGANNNVNHRNYGGRVNFSGYTGSKAQSTPRNPVVNKKPKTSGIGTKINYSQGSSLKKYLADRIECSDNDRTNFENYCMLRSSFDKNQIEKKHLTDLKHMVNPTGEIKLVVECCLILLQLIHSKISWGDSKKYMTKSKRFLDHVEMLKNNIENLDEDVIDSVESYIESEQFNVKTMGSKSRSAGKMAEYVVSAFKLAQFCDHFNNLRAAKNLDD